MVTKAKTKYEVTNWGKYNESLVQRGSVTFWFNEDVLQNWSHSNDKPKVGRPFVYSDSAISCLLILRELYRLPYRQVEGFARSLVQLLRAKITIPDYTSLAKRAQTLEVPRAVSQRKGPIDVVVDSTGLKVFGEGEWKMRTHGKSKRRTWRKIHLAINPETQEIEAEVLTENRGHDADQVDDLLRQIPKPVTQFYGDGCYDKWKVYQVLAQKQIQPIIPPQHNAKIKQHGNSSQPPQPRDEAIRGIRLLGRKTWKKKVNYHRRSLAETAMHRLKTIFGRYLRNRLLPTQRTECSFRCHILNRFTQRGMPAFEWS